jgi:predicted nicotinamide N-methyase
MAYITIQIPPDATPGVDTLTFQYQGQELEIAIPPDAQVGDVLQIQVGANNDDVVDGDNVDGTSDEGGKKSSLLDELGGISDKDETVIDDKEDTPDAQDDTITNVALGSSTDPSATLQLVESIPGMTQNEGDGTNAMVWPSGIVLAQALTCNAGLEYMRHVFDRKKSTTNAESTCSSCLHCLELGSGLGVCGLALAHALTLQNLESRVVLTDLGDAAMKLLEENVNRNQQALFASVKVETEPLIWGETLPNANQKFDVILGSDLLYNTNESYDPLLQTISHHLHPDGAMILAVRWRKPDLEKQFFEKAAALGFEFDLWHVMKTSEFKTRCPCQLSWKEYGDSECEALKTFFCETKVAEISESDMERMNGAEYTKFEECQIQVYVGKFVNEKMAAKKRSIGEISS